MADSAVVHIGENSPEQVALKLLEIISRVERRSMNTAEQSDLSPSWVKADRKWILDTYSECLESVKGNRTKPRQWPSEIGQ
jgi:hypothetical protein